MAFTNYKKIRVPPDTSPTPKQVNDVQDNVAQALSQLLGKDQLDSSVIKNVVLLPGVINTVSHTLGRPLTGWTIIRTHGSYNLVYDVQDTCKSPNLLLLLMTPTKITVDLLCF